jgi:hypothetical protein
MNRAVITPAEADVILAQFADWIALSDALKLSHITKASVYAQTQRTCVDVDWTDSLLVPADIKEAVAYYAAADMHGNLFGDVSTLDSDKGKIKKERSKVGSLEEEFEYSGSVPLYSTRRSLGYPDVLIETLCTKKSGEITLTRV